MHVGSWLNFLLFPYSLLLGHSLQPLLISSLSMHEYLLQWVAGALGGVLLSCLAGPVAMSTKAAVAAWAHRSWVSALTSALLLVHPSEILKCQ